MKYGPRKVVDLTLTSLSTLLILVRINAYILVETLIIKAELISREILIQDRYDPISERFLHLLTTAAKNI